jgi:hypothetical protein
MARSRLLLCCCMILLPWSASAGWQEVGPERGHVIDAAASAESVWVSSRAGVLRASLDMASWGRDPRFPRDTRQIAASPGGALWATPGQSIWRAGDGAEQLHRLDAGSLAVELVPLGERGVLALVRGAQPGVLALLPAADGAMEAVWSLRGEDPWAALADGAEVWVATVDGGLWKSDDGARSFEREDRDLAVDALGLVAGQALAATAEGGILDLRRGRSVGAAPGHRFVAIADDGGLPLLVSTGGGPGQSSVLRLEGGDPVPVELSAFQDDIGLLTPTRAWSLPGQGALLGTFREGPIHIQGGKASLARDGFRAGVTGGAAMDDAGRLLVAMMGTGTYVSDDDGETWRQEEGGDAPVTDAVEVIALGSRFAVLDFEGLTVQDRAGTWHRWPYPQGLQPGQHQGIVDLAQAGDDATWGLDAQGGLWRFHGGSWARCTGGGGVAIDSDGARGWMLGRGVRLLGACDREPSAAWPGSPALPGTDQGALALPWVVAGGALWRDGQRVTQLAPGRVAAMAGRRDDALIAYESGAVLACDAGGCERLDPPLPSAVRALGWTSDGRVWAAEQRGTVLVSGGSTSPAAWYLPGGGSVPDGSLFRLEAPHWLRIQQPGPPVGHGQPGAGAPGQAQAAPAPQPSAAEPASPARGSILWLLSGVVVVVVGAGLLLRRWRRARTGP